MPKGKHPTPHTYILIRHDAIPLDERALPAGLAEDDAHAVFALHLLRPGEQQRHEGPRAHDADDDEVRFERHRARRVCGRVEPEDDRAADDGRGVAHEDPESEHAAAAVGFGVCWVGGGGKGGRGREGRVLRDYELLEYNGRRTGDDGPFDGIHESIGASGYDRPEHQEPLRPVFRVEVEAPCVTTYSYSNS